MRPLECLALAIAAIAHVGVGAAWAEAPPADFVAAQANARVAFGEAVPADRGSFISVVALENRTDNNMVGHCGGTVIGEHWILTAAHCVARQEGRPGVNRPERFAVRTTLTSPGAGQDHALRIVEVRVPADYTFRPGAPHDVALLRLAEPVGLPRQLLLSASLRAELEQAGRTAIVAGFGLTETQQLASELRRAEVPIIANSECRTRWRVNQNLRPDDLGAAVLCAGEGKAGARDSCPGDSGGPLFVRDPVGNLVQLGIVSWGPNEACGAATLPGVYAAVAAHERWIRGIVPDARFAEAAPPPGLVAPPPQGLAPSSMPQVSVDIVQGNTLHVGDAPRLRIASSIDGALVVFLVDAAGVVQQLMPTRDSGAGDAGEARLRLRAGEPTLFPGKSDTVGITVGDPPGRTRIIALVLPETTEVRAGIGQHLDGADIPVGLAFIQDLMDRARAAQTRSTQLHERRDLVAPPNVGMGDVWFTVAPRRS